MFETSWTDAGRHVTGTVRREAEEYAAGQDRPLAGYLTITGVYLGLVALLLALAWRRGRLSARPGAADLALLGVATHKLSRTVSKDAVASPLRAPFTRFEGPAGPAEVHEEVRGRGFRHAMGELLACPFCLAQWSATVLVFGFLFAPRATRVLAGVLAARAASDFLQFAYARIQPQPNTAPEDERS